ncbi:MAG: FKBP-type peptidyl-prolyl cis-trans isomerase [Caulobacteraceae bacterium]
MFRFLLIAVAALSLAACHGKLPGQGEGPQASASAEAAAAKAFLAKNAKEPGVVTLPDGLQYKIISSGPATGAKPHLGDEVKVNYEGKLTNGKDFDSSYERGQPAAMPLKGLVKAWQEIIPMMRPGDVWMIYVPPELGYGDEGAGNGEIPGGAALIFKIELIDFLPGPGSVEQG